MENPTLVFKYEPKSGNEGEQLIIKMLNFFGKKKTFLKIGYKTKDISFVVAGSETGSVNDSSSEIADPVPYDPYHDALNLWVRKYQLLMHQRFYYQRNTCYAERYFCINSYQKQ